MRFAPVDLPESGRVRLNRLYPGAWSRRRCVRSWCRGRRPPPVGGQPIRDEALLDWVARGHRLRDRPARRAGGRVVTGAYGLAAAEGATPCRDPPMPPGRRRRRHGCRALAGSLTSLTACSGHRPRRGRRRRRARRSRRAGRHFADLLCSWAASRAAEPAAPTRKRGRAGSSAPRSTTSCRSTSSDVDAVDPAAVEQAVAQKARRPGHAARGRMRDTFDEFVERVRPRPGRPSQEARPRVARGAGGRPPRSPTTTPSPRASGSGAELAAEADISHRPALRHDRGRASSPGSGYAVGARSPTGGQGAELGALRPRWSSRLPASLKCGCRGG